MDGKKRDTSGRGDEVALRWLEELDERLRVGESTATAQRGMLRRYGIDAEQFFECLNGISAHAALMRATLEKGMEFRYQSFRILLDLIRQEQFWKRQHCEILSQHRIQASIMRLLPLVMLLFLIDGDDAHVGLYSLSLWLHMAGELMVGFLTEELSR